MLLGVAARFGRRREDEGDRAFILEARRPELDRRGGAGVRCGLLSNEERPYAEIRVRGGCVDIGGV